MLLLYGLIVRNFQTEKPPREKLYRRQDGTNPGSHSSWLSEWEYVYRNIDVRDVDDVLGVKAGLFKRNVDDVLGLEGGLFERDPRDLVAIEELFHPK